MTWNYRVVHENGYYSIKEVYYDKNGSPIASMDGGVELKGYESIQEIIEDLEYILQALKASVLIDEHGKLVEV